MSMYDANNISKGTHRYQFEGIHNLDHIENYQKMVIFQEYNPVGIYCTVF